MEYGETLGVVGESGCVASPLWAGPYCAFMNPRRAGGLQGKEPGGIRQRRDAPDAQGAPDYISDPYSSLNPRMTVRELICAPLDVFAMGSKEEKEAR